jgi:4-diphosphocytidyl-2-C-methyl-D-erythritol kinase
MIIFPNIKINLGLNILRKREDNFHDISSLFYPVQWTDIIEITERNDNKIEFENTGLIVDCLPEKNLIVKVFRLLANDYTIPGMTLHLHKVVPFGAGLGAGSSDAAALLKGLNEYCALHLSKEKLTFYATQLGSDCAFFIENRPCLVKGKGEILQETNINLSGYQIVIIKPDFSVSTAEAYANIHPVVPDLSIEEIIQKPIGEWNNLLNNDFEASVFSKYSLLIQLKNDLYKQGAIYASMSGSGSAIFGIFNKKIDTEGLWPSCTVWHGTL